MYKKIDKYMRAHPWYNASVHAIGGIAVGVLITYPFISNPVKVGVLLLVVATLGHIFPLTVKK